MKKRAKRVWAVLGQDGWHAASPNNEPAQAAYSVSTRCNAFMILPWEATKLFASELDCALCGDAVVSAQNRKGKSK